MKSRVIAAVSVASLLLAAAPALSQGQLPRPGQLPPPGGQGAPPPQRGQAAPPQQPAAAAAKPYKPVAITAPAAVTDPSFEAFRKQLGAVAEKKDRKALAGLVVPNFFWMGEKGDKANKRKSAIDNLAAAIDLDGKDGAGWEILTEAANETTLEAVPDRKGVMCSPASPSYDQKAAAQNAKATGTDFGDWGFPTKGTVDVHAAAQAGAPVIEKLGSVLVRVMPDEPPAGAQGNAPAPGSTFVRVVTPSGKVGFVPDDALASLDVDQLCYAKDIPTNKCNGYGGCCRGAIL
jgi:hypothetical protein